MHISLVVPAYKCSECIEVLYSKIIESFFEMHIEDFEIFFINDGSPDSDWEVISKLCERDHRVKGINLSRNFGQHKAIAAGLRLSKGEWVIVMDCDLQDQPEYISKLYQEALKGHDVVLVKRVNRKDHFFKRLFSKIFNIIFNYLIDRKTDNAVSNFSIMNRKIVNEIIKMNERHIAHVLCIYWLGFDVAYIDMPHSERYSGVSAYNFTRAFNLAIDFAISQSNKPLRLLVKFGITLSLFSAFYGFYLIVNYYIHGISLLGWTSIMVSMYFTSGLLLASMGILGIYIGRIYDEVKARPLYAIKDLKNVDK